MNFFRQMLHKWSRNNTKQRESSSQKKGQNFLSIKTLHTKIMLKNIKHIQDDRKRSLMHVQARKSQKVPVDSCYTSTKKGPRIYCERQARSIPFSQQHLWRKGHHPLGRAIPSLLPPAGRGKGRMAMFSFQYRLGFLSVLLNKSCHILSSIWKTRLEGKVEKYSIIMLIYFVKCYYF